MLEKTLVVRQRISYVRQEEELGNHHVEGDPLSRRQVPGLGRRGEVLGVGGSGARGQGGESGQT